MTRHPIATGACGLALVFLAGCASKPSVTGTVSFDGAPVDGGVINFVPEGGQRAEGGRASAEIKDGKYAIPAEKIPPPGRYRVEILWNKKTGKDVPNPTDPGTTMPETKQVIPVKYNTRSELTADIKVGGNSIDFPLTPGGPVAPGSSGSSGGKDPNRSKAIGD